MTKKGKPIPSFSLKLSVCISFDCERYLIANNPPARKPPLPGFFMIFEKVRSVLDNDMKQ
jgi:hypothetical protein